MSLIEGIIRCNHGLDNIHSYDRLNNLRRAAYNRHLQSHHQGLQIRVGLAVPFQSNWYRHYRLKNISVIGSEL